MPDEFPPTPDHPGDARPSSDSDAPGSGQPSRRSFLTSAGTAAAGLAATAGLGATAGCVEVLPAMGQEIRFDDVAMPDAPAPHYREWIPPQEIDAEDHLVPGIVAVPNNDSESVTGVPLNYGRGFLAGGMDYFGIGFENYDVAFSLSDHPNDVYVLEGPIAPEEVGSTLLDSGYEADAQLRGYDRYVREDIPRTVAVQNGRILFGTGPDRDAAIERALDANAGEDSLATNDRGLARVTDRAGLRPFLIMGTAFNGIGDDYLLEWHASGTDFDEDGFYFFHYLLFADDRPSRDELEDDVESMDVAEDADVVEIERDGQLAAIEIHLSSATVESEFDTANEQVPQTTWGLEDDGNTIAIRHEAGDAIPAEYLALRDGWANDPELPTQFSDEYSSVGPGAAVSVDREEIVDGPLSLMWEDGESSIILLEYRP